ncbi:protein kinase family protein [Nesterenkonia sp. E16_7]|uniref:protein kinase family protein n=1 Tax=unclassified Nesterenkonia TaxID=2629769 RepID=UPI001A91D5B8|nr:MULTISPECIES: protein kinase family protein [unclassified Nesterenkonia]MBO0594863.1 protein kinase family protein [Nesterenkonia sp. E16_10]MBO0597112.1 protein kinase family protein [Nesterenkonia sp. E16_7]
MNTMEQERVERFERTFYDQDIDRTYLELYRREQTAPRAFAAIHAGLDAEFKWMNYKSRDGRGGHFNADNSRSLRDLIDQVTEARKVLSKAGHELVVSPEYQRVIENAPSWLTSSGGSAIPEGFTPIQVESYAPVFSLGDRTVKLTDSHTVKLTPIGEGAFAVVHRFTDPNYGMKLARKKLKPGADDREKERFRREFELMKELQFPYVLEVYRFKASDWSYTMEHCDTTLEEHVAKRNNQPGFGLMTRKRIALQFLYGLNYIHSKGHFHRDLSIRNVLLRTFGGSAVIVKLSDFGLAKRQGSEFTVTETELKGTKLDPALGSFKEFESVHDIFAAGFVLLYIFTGRKNVGRTATTSVEHIVQKCIDSQPDKRYQRVIDLIADVEALQVDAKGVPA